MKVVELTPANFQKLIITIKELKLQIKKLENANEFLNKEIEEYQEFNKFIRGQTDANV